MTYLRTGWQALVQGIALIGASQLGESCNETFGESVSEAISESR